MAKQSYKKITAVKASTIAMFEGTFAGAVGFVVAIMYSLNTTVEIAEATNSTLKGLSFGLATGIVSLLVLPLIYFALGWVVGYLHGAVFNAVVGSSGGIEVKIEE